MQFAASQMLLLFCSMSLDFSLTRTTTADPGFQALVAALDHELWHELKEDQATYDGYNKVPDIKTAILLTVHEQPAAIGCFKPFNETTVEIKRMFVAKAFRGHGLAKTVLTALEEWAKENGYANAVLETSVHFTVARNLYESRGYSIIPNYPPYQNLPESVCLKKAL